MNYKNCINQQKFFAKKIVVTVGALPKLNELKNVFTKKMFLKDMKKCLTRLD